MNPILTSTLSYMIVLILALVIMSFMQRGFFWKFFKVKISFGKLVIVKVRSINRDYYRVGRIESGFLLFKGSGKYDVRVSVPDSSFFYRSIGVNWIDLEEQKNAISKTDYTAVTGFDAEKYNNLYIRALTKPQLLNTDEKILIGLIIGAIIGLIIVGYFAYHTSQDVTLIKESIESLRTIKPSPVVGV